MKHLILLIKQKDQAYLTSKISKFFSPEGVSTIIASPTLLPIKALPIGDLKYIRFFEISASSFPTIL